MSSLPNLREPRQFFLRPAKAQANPSLAHLIQQTHGKISTREAPRLPVNLFRLDKLLKVLPMPTGEKPDPT
jgi:hypothetical protein